ncbi:MAG: alpha-N-arabinofuranosidase [Bacteroidales bacterium]|nr:alpha-N-arabinofuranosidase [Bacteroidales bacterium]MDT8373134.1 alpha-N-arabinofuranosidase [Bacteroidales bacterium]
MRLSGIITSGILILSALAYSASAQSGEKSGQANIIISTDLGTQTISRHIYGHFSEHLGHCIYGGYWVGEDAAIPNTRGIRNDVVEALRKTQIPNLRWPGGCFADEYHWMDGIGPREQRPKMVNTHWGGVTEDNSFGTHEFLDLCEQLGAEPVICGNVGSGSVEEMSKWVEYINFDGVSPMADLRRKNGRDKPWNVRYWGVGNENWGCGGHMTADFYADQFRRYATYTRNYGNNRLMKIAGGANTTDYNWTETLMRDVPHFLMWGVSLHYYTTYWEKKGSATKFGEKEYFETLERCLNIETALDRHITIMDKYDPAKRIALVVDEWGTWWDVEPGTNPGFLFQQNTLRDAMVAGLSLNYFNERCDRIKMANIAQTVNVLQSLIFTDGEKMLLTPTYHVFEMYKVHQDATLLPLAVNCGTYAMDGRELASISASASKDKNGAVHISVVNIEPSERIELLIDLRGGDFKEVSARILTASELNTHNTFEKPEEVRPAAFRVVKIKKNILSLDMPAKSIIMLEVK